MGLRPTFSVEDGPVSSKDRRLLGLIFLPLVTFIRAILLVLMKLAEISKTKSSKDYLSYFGVFN